MSGFTTARRQIIPVWWRQPPSRCLFTLMPNPERTRSPWRWLMPSRTKEQKRVPAKLQPKWLPDCSLCVSSVFVFRHVGGGVHSDLIKQYHSSASGREEAAVLCLKQFPVKQFWSFFSFASRSTCKTSVRVWRLNFCSHRQTSARSHDISDRKLKILIILLKPRADVLISPPTPTIFFLKKIAFCLNG